MSVPSIHLNRTRATKSIGIGLAFWLVAAMTVRMARPGGPLDGMFGAMASMWTFAASVPVMWLVVRFIQRVASLTSQQVVSGVVLAAAAASLCDAVALTWVTELYGSDKTRVLHGAAWILWGASFGLIFAYIEAERASAGS